MTSISPAQLYRTPQLQNVRPQANKDEDFKPAAPLPTNSRTDDPSSAQRSSFKAMNPSDLKSLADKLNGTNFFSDKERDVLKSLADAAMKENQGISQVRDGKILEDGDVPFDVFKSLASASKNTESPDERKLLDGLLKKLNLLSGVDTSA